MLMILCIQPGRCPPVDPHELPVLYRMAHHGPDVDSPELVAHDAEPAAVLVNSERSPVQVKEQADVPALVSRVRYDYEFVIK